MEIKPISNRMYALVILYDMHTKFFKSVIAGISENDIHNRLNTKANHIAWLTGSLVEQRYEIANELGVDRKQAAHDLFKEGKGIQDNVNYPSLATFQKDWDFISPILKEALMNVPDERLDKLFEMPGIAFPFFDMITFVIYREANIIGQIALWRRLLGYEGMKYD